MTDKVYIVTHGDYSDYSILQVFSIKELAEKYINEYHGTIEEFDVDVPKDYWFVYIVMMNKNFELSKEYPVDKYPAADDFPPYGFCSYDREQNFIYSVIADSEEKAIKVTSEKLTEILANNLYGDDKATRAYFEAKK